MRKRDTKLSTVSALIEFWLEYGLPLDADKFEHDTKCRNILRGQLTLPHLLFLINSRQCCVPLAIKAAEHICAPLLLLFGNPIISAHLSAVFSILLRLPEAVKVAVGEDLFDLVPFVKGKENLGFSPVAALCAGYPAWCEATPIQCSAPAASDAPQSRP